MWSNSWARQAYIGKIAWGVDPKELERERSARLRKMVEGRRREEAS